MEQVEDKVDKESRLTKVDKEASFLFFPISQSSYQGVSQTVDVSTKFYLAKFDMKDVNDNENIVKTLLSQIKNAGEGRLYHGTQWGAISHTETLNKMALFCNCR